MKHIRHLSLLLLAGGLIVFPLAGAAGGLLYVVIARPIRRWPWPAASVTVGVAAVLAGLASDWKVDALAGAGATLLLGLALFLVYTRLAESDAAWVVAGAALGLLPSALLAAFQARDGAQAVAFTFHPNIAAALFTVGIFGVLGGLATRPPGPRWVQRSLAPVWLVVAAASALALALTGSRSGVMGFGAGLVVLAPLLVAAAWRRWGGRALTIGAVAAAALVAVLVLAALPGPSTGNLVVNSGFEAGSYPWRFGGGSERATTQGTSLAAGVEQVDGAWSALLVHSAPGWQALLSSGEPIRANPGQQYTVSLYALPAAGGIPGVFLRVEARGETGAFLGRAGLEGWTTGDESKAGGRWRLPTLEGSPGTRSAAGATAWQRFEAALPPLPTGTAELSITVAADSRDVGAYGLVDAIQVEAGTAATPYRAGPSAGVRAYLGPLVPRLLGLRDPIAASGGRISMWHFSLQFAAARPFLGYGFGVVEHLVAQQAPRYVADPLNHPHSFYLQLLLEGGTLLLMAVLGWLGLVGWRLLRAALRGSWPAATALAGLVALLVQSVFDPVLAWGPAVGLWWGFVCGATTAGPEIGPPS